MKRKTVSAALVYLTLIIAACFLATSAAEAKHCGYGGCRRVHDQAGKDGQVAQAEKRGELARRDVERVHECSGVRLGAEVIVNEPSGMAGALTHGGLVLAEVTHEPERTDPLQVRWAVQG